MKAADKIPGAEKEEIYKIVKIVAKVTLGLLAIIAAVAIAVLLASHFGFSVGIFSSATVSLGGLGAAAGGIFPADIALAALLKVTDRCAAPPTKITTSVFGFFAKNSESEEAKKGRGNQVTDMLLGAAASALKVQ